MKVRIHNVSTEYVDSAGVTREVRGTMKPERAARMGYKNITLVYRDAEGRITEKVLIA